MQLSSDNTSINTVAGALTFGITGLSNADKRIAEIFCQKTDAATTGGTGDLIFYTWNAGVGQEKMRITSGGNVGIGTPGPPSTLSIYKIIRTSLDDSSLSF